MSQYGAKLAQDGLKMAQDGFKMGSDGVKMGQDGVQMAQMKPQDAPWSPPGDIGEACVFLLPRGGLAEHVPIRELCVFTMVLLAF